MKGTTSGVQTTMTTSNTYQLHLMLQIKGKNKVSWSAYLVNHYNNEIVTQS